MSDKKVGMKQEQEVKDVRIIRISSAEQFIPEIEWPALAEFVELINKGEIPQDSKFAVALARGEVGGKMSETMSIQIAILPDGKFRLLQSGSNTELIEKFDNIGKDVKVQKPIRRNKIELTGKMLEITLQEKEIPEFFIPEGYAKCKECGELFKKVGKRLFCSERCRSRYTVRESRRRRKEQ